MVRSRSKVVPFRSGPRKWTRAGDYGVRTSSPKPRAKLKRRWRPRISPIMVMLPLAVLTAVWVWPGEHEGVAVELPRIGATDLESARFSLCGSGARVNCVIDGDTFWYEGEKFRIADINTPEVSQPACEREAELGKAATERMQALLNAGGFTLEPVDRNRDQYGRLLRTVTRDGVSLGQELVDQGLAEEWQGYRGSWC